MPTEQTDASPKEQISVRIPRSLLDKVDAYAARSSGSAYSSTSRNTAILSLIDRGLADATRPRKK